MALTSGITCGVGNFFLGGKLAHAGAMGPGLSGPLGLLILLTYRAGTFIRTKVVSGSFVDKSNSNWYKPEQPHLFRYSHLVPLFCNFAPNLLSLIFIA